MFPKVQRRLSARSERWVLPALLILFLLLFAFPPGPALAQSGALPNPDLNGRCGLDIILAIDESGSFQGFESAMRYGVRSLLDLVADTGSRVALVEFNLDARAPLGLGFVTVTAGAGGTSSAGGVFDLYLTHNYQPNGSTNWEAAFLKIEEINRTQGVAPLVIFLTDGQPTAFVNQFGSIIAGDSGESIAEAIPAANLVKTQGSHIFVVGIGATSAEEAGLIAVSGDNPYPALSLRSGQADYLLTTLSGLEGALQRLVFELCAASLSVVKRENLGDGQGYVLKAGQRFTATVAINEPGQPVDAFEWLEPAAGAAATAGTSQPLLTNSNGVARWQWLPGARQTPQNWSTAVTLIEEPAPNRTVAAATCTRKFMDNNGVYQTQTLSILPFPSLLSIGAYELVTCDVRNAQLGIAVKKIATPLVVPESGGDVAFTFEVLNHSSIAVRLTALTDSIFGNLHNQGTCVAGGFTVIEAGKSYSCTLTRRLVGNAGSPHQNTVSATVVDANQNRVTAQAAATVNFTDALPLVTLNRNATPLTLNEPGDLVTYGVQVSNQSAGEAMTLTALSDTPYGNVATVGGAIQSTTCVLPQTIAPAGQPGATYNCTFTVQLTGAPGPYPDTLTATLQDDDGNSLTLTKEQLVTIVNTAPAATLSVTPAPAAFPEPGGPVTFAVVVANTSAAEGLTLSALTDNRYGNLTITGGAITNTTCQLPQTLAPAGQPNARYECTFTTNVTGNPGLYPNTVQATVSDDDSGSLQLVHESVVEITDLPATLVVTKRAARTSLPEPGGNMTFTVTVANTSQIDHVRVDQVVDDQFGSINGSCLPALPADLAPQQQIRCQFVAPIPGLVGQRHINVITASGVDDDGNPIADRDQEIVEITDLPARLDIIQTADPSNLPEPGGTVTFTALIANISTVDQIRIDQIETNDVTEDPFQSAAVAISCTPTLPATIRPGEQLRCHFTKLFTGPIGARHTSRVTVTGVDDDDLPVQQSGYETIEIVDLAAAVRVTQSANPVSVPESGGMVELTVQVQNSSAVDTITLQSLTNSRFGDLAPGCATPLPLNLAPGATLTCRVSRFIQGDTNSAITLLTTAAGIDDDNRPVRDEAALTIGVTDTPSTIKVVQTTNPSSLQEPGGLLLFTVAVENSSAVDSVTIQHVHDSRFGDLGSSCTPVLPATLAPQAKVLCQFSRTLTGEAGTTFASTVSASGVDDDGQTVTDFDVSNLDVMDVPPQAVMTLTAAPNRLLETGGLVTTTVRLLNNGPEALTLERLFDRAGTNLHGRGSCRVPQTLPPNGVYQCTFVTNVAAAVATTYQILVTAEVSDNDGNRVQSADKADIFLVAVSPDLLVTKRDRLLVDRFTNEQDRGKPSPGDTLGYEITVRNRGNGPATNIILTDVPDANTRLVIGSVQSSKGSVIVGNQPHSQPVVLVELGEIASGEQATITFAVTITEGAGATLLRNQATVSHGITGATAAGSDDPDTPFVGDPTDTIVFLPPTTLPPGEEPQRRLFLPLVQR